MWQRFGITQNIYAFSIVDTNFTAYINIYKVDVTRWSGSLSKSENISKTHEWIV